jgi:hypothetical protein
MRLVETAKEFQQLTRADIKEAILRLLRCGAGLEPGETPTKERLMASSPDAQESDAEIYVEILRISSVICHAAKRDGRMPYFRPRWPIEWLGLSMANADFKYGVPTPGAE